MNNPIGRKDGKIEVKVPKVDNRRTIKVIADSNSKMAEAINTLAKSNTMLAELLNVSPKINIQDNFISNSETGIGISLESKYEDFSEKLDGDLPTDNYGMEEMVETIEEAQLNGDVEEETEEEDEDE